MDFHRLSSNRGEPIILGKRFGTANVAGSGAGSSVSTNISFTDKFGSGLLPQTLSYIVNVSPTQPAFVVISNKSTNGFTVTHYPKDSSTTLSAGSFDLTVLG
jgi:hypothetical protein